MREIISTITSKGQVTVPAVVRRQLGLKRNDKISFLIDDAGKVSLTAPRYPNIASIVGIAGSLKEPLSVQQMREITMEDRLASHDPDSDA